MKGTNGAVGLPGAGRGMIVDDNPEMLGILREAASMFIDAPIDCCGTPQAAIEAFELGADEYGFVITDFEMPGMNGAELCRQLRNASPSLKVLLATGSKKITLAEAKEQGFCGLLDKPFAVGALKEAMTAAGIL